MSSPSRDYPAAHSMDSTWFAVDEVGNLAVFDTGEGGALPEGDFPMGGEAGGYHGDSLETTGLLARALMARAQSDEALAALLPKSMEALEKRISKSDAWDEVDKLLSSAGVFTYVCDEPFAAPYVRDGKPPSPLPVSAFDADTQRRFANAALPLRFADASVLAPGEHTEVAAWGPIWIDTKGKPHPTGDCDDFESEVADWEEWAEEDWSSDDSGEATPVYQGEEFYAKVRELVGDPSGGDEEPPKDKGGKSWLGRLFGKK